MHHQQLSRRDLLKTGLAASAAIACSPLGSALGATSFESDLPVKVVTEGPQHHWFGYYDKLQFDPTGRYLLSMQVDFEHRKPKADDEIRLGVIDLQNENKWTQLGTTTAWGWQQGCMFQWVPGNSKKVIWNTRGQDRYGSRVLDIETGTTLEADQPVYALSPDGKSAVTADFRRINDVRPGYGYVGLPDPHADDNAPKDSGIFHVDLVTGKSKLILSLAEIIQHGEVPWDGPDVKHYVNHLLVNPDGTRFEFLHRSRLTTGKWKTRMLTANLDGSDVRVLDANGMTSHFIWRDPQHLLAWSDQPSHGKAFYIFSDEEKPKIEAVGTDVMTRDGHCTYLPNRDWIVNDTYPDAQRFQTVYLYHVPTGKRVDVAKFHSPKTYSGEWRCDTHPRHSPDGRLLVVDAPFEDQGRQLHVVDISSIVG
ncbi:twin-arginine translocation signal domain-containing protein [Bremerella sp. JC770]|uniref:twin-arginine translocation signal domain-containing protein n=1 Tax=Bremerella sp. JC770 TaxID=3232137 RepID=UPI0034594061